MKVNISDNAYFCELVSSLEAVQLFVTQADPNVKSGYSKIVSLLTQVFLEKREENAQIIFIGNGGSAAIASHMTADYMKNGKMNTHSLYDSALVTCMGNDYGYENVFAKPLDMCIRPGDLLVAISSSGNSQNIINAIDVAKLHNATVITFTGFKPNNTARAMGDYNLYVPCNRYGIVESIHNLILQQIVDEIMDIGGAFKNV